MRSPSEDASNGYRFERVVNVDSRVRQEAALLAQVFDNPSRYTDSYLRWQYYANPDGDIVGYDAIDRETGALAAHYVVQPLRATVFGESRRGVLSLNTATHASHQGRGLFVRLAQMTYELAAAEGHSFVVGVANANSTPGFTRKLGFQLVSPLDAFIGIGHPVVRRQALDLEFSRVWSAEAREWRIERPGARYWISDGRPFAKAQQTLFKACLSSIDGWHGTDVARAPFTPLTVWLGLRPHCGWSGIRTPLPARLRPSPLNLIFRPLSDMPKALEPGRVAFEAIDFDAY